MQPRGTFWVGIKMIKSDISSVECYNVLTPFCQLSRKLSLKFAALK